MVSFFATPEVYMNAIPVFDGKKPLLLLSEAVEVSRIFYLPQNFLRNETSHNTLEHGVHVCELLKMLMDTLFGISLVL